MTSSPAATPAEGDLLWTPSPARIARASLIRFSAWLRDERGREFVDYDELRRWSVADLDGFWQCVWDYFEIRASPPRCVLEKRTMPGAQWFPSARLNYAEHALRHERPGAPAAMFISERESLRVIGWEELGGQVRVLAERLRALGVRPGHRVVAYMPNVPEALVAMLASASRPQSAPGLRATVRHATCPTRSSRSLRSPIRLPGRKWSFRSPGCLLALRSRPWRTVTRWSILTRWTTSLHMRGPATRETLERSWTPMSS